MKKRFYLFCFCLAIFCSPVVLLRAQAGPFQKDIQNTPQPAINMSSILTLPFLKAPDLTTILGEIQDKERIAFSFEQVLPGRVDLGNSSDEPNFRFYARSNSFGSGLMLKAGSYTVDKMMKSLQQQAASLQKMRWKASNRTVNVIFSADTLPSNPLDLKIGHDTTLKVTLSQFLRWLDLQTPTAEVGHPFIRHDVSAVEPNEVTVLKVANGTTLRQVINLYAEATNRLWRADIYRQNAWSSSYKDPSNGRVIRREAASTIRVDVEFASANVYRL